MQEYYFLFVLALVWVIFAAIQDSRTTEISNWLNFSFIAFGLGYRAFYSASINDYSFLIYGLLGLGLFFVLGLGLYYSRIFAGGDAKLLFGFGVIFPYSEGMDFLIYGGGFAFALLAFGVLYTLIYSGFIAYNNKDRFVSQLRKEVRKGKVLSLIGFFGGVVLIFLANYFGVSFLILGAFVFLWPLIYFYVQAVEKGCMIVSVKPGKLMEGDWLVSDVRVGNRVIKKSVHGLTKKDIELLRKVRKSVVIRRGVPFAAAFVFAYIAFLVIIFKEFFVLV